MGNWAQLTLQFDVPETKRIEFEASIELSGWRPIEGMRSCWYGRLGRMNWKQVLITVEQVLEIAALTVGIEEPIHFVVHTGDSPPHYGIAQALDPEKRRTKGFQRGHRTRPVDGNKSFMPLAPTKKLTKNIDPSKG